MPPEERPPPLEMTSPLPAPPAEEAGAPRSRSSRIASLRKRAPPAHVPVVDLNADPSEVAKKPLSSKRSRPSSKKQDVTAKNKGGKPSPAACAPKKEAPTRQPKGKEAVVVDLEDEDDSKGEAEAEVADDNAVDVLAPVKQRKAVPRSRVEEDGECRFVGQPIPEAEARDRWPARYQPKSAASSSKTEDGDMDDKKALRHYEQAKVDDVIYKLNDDVYVKAAEGEDDYIGRIVEFFEATDQKLCFTSQWFFRTKDTVIKDVEYDKHDQRRVFFSEEQNVNMLDCIVSKIKIVKVASNIGMVAKEALIQTCDLYFDMTYSIPYSAFSNLPTDIGLPGSETSTVSSEDSSSLKQKPELSLLDMYSGCGAMSTGLCFGAEISGINLVTKWAVDFNKFACESLRLNHPETKVHNETADNFLSLIREWKKLCDKYSILGNESFGQRELCDQKDLMDSRGVPEGEFEVEKILDICYGDPHKTGTVGLKFKVRWKGYGPADDTWEPLEGLSKCEEKILDFVRSSSQKKILPLPGMVDVICGGPPCQGISGFNLHRKREDPLSDDKNRQMLVFMDIVEFLQPKYVLMENVLDILRFADGFFSRYVLSRLIRMNYQAKLGILAAGSFGLAQFRMRCFIWGAHRSQKLPQFPLPSHNVIVRGGVPNEFQGNLVAYDEDERPKLEKALVLGDIISDLPSVTNYEEREEMPYGKDPETDFQRFIRLPREGFVSTKVLFDHLPLQLNDDDYQRVCRIPKRKGACFRDLPGVAVRADNVVEWDANIPREYLPSGKFLVPDYCMTYVNGKSSKPFARLWWDETVPTVITRAEPHNHAILHPEQDRVLTIRENARLQGFPDFYKLCGPRKQMYVQVGNAVAFPVSRALGFGLGLAYQHRGSDKPIFCLPRQFPVAQLSPEASDS